MRPVAVPILVHKSPYPLTRKPELEAGKPRRRRRKPEAAESEILDAAESFLKERPFREMTIDDIMSRTGLSRPSFYEYFRDRHHLVMKLTERLGDWTYAMGEQWLDGDPSAEMLQNSIGRLVDLYTTKGHLLRALSDAATFDRQVENAYSKMIGRFVDGTAEQIRRGVQNGTMSVRHPDEVASALVVMTERFLIQKCGYRDEVDPRVIADTLVTIWKRALYGA